jgi:hypothetical protein
VARGDVWRTALRLVGPGEEAVAGLFRAFALSLLGRERGRERERTADAGLFLACANSDKLRLGLSEPRLRSIVFVTALSVSISNGRIELVFADVPPVSPPASVCVCVCAYMYIRLYACMYVYIYVYMRQHTSAYVSISCFCSLPLPQVLPHLLTSASEFVLL